MTRLPVTEVLDPAPADGPDWAAVERDYRTGAFTIRELEARHPGTSRSAIDRRAKRDGWVQDLSAAVATATQAKLAQAATGETRPGTSGGTKRGTKRDGGTTETVSQRALTARAERQTVEDQAAAEVAATVDAVATQNAGVVLGQRDRATRLATVSVAMLEELADQAELAQHSDQIIDALAGAADGEEPDPQKLAKVREAVHRALGLGSRAATLAKIAEALTKAQVLERQAYQLDAPQDPGASLARLPDPATIPPEQYMAVYMAFVTGVGKPAALPAPARSQP